jgi:hypothetical protein
MEFVNYVNSLRRKVRTAEITEATFERLMEEAEREAEKAGF